MDEILLKKNRTKKEMFVTTLPYMLATEHYDVIVIE